MREGHGGEGRSQERPACPVGRITSHPELGSSMDWTWDSKSRVHGQAEHPWVLGGRYEQHTGHAKES